MPAKRIIVRLDIDAGRVVDGGRSRRRDLGDPAAMAAHYEAEGADGIVFVHVQASAEDRAPMLEAVRRTAERVRIPLTVAGGMESLDAVDHALQAGADRVGINTGAVWWPEMLSDVAQRVGAERVVACVDAKRDAVMQSGYRVFTHGGRRPTDLDALDWATRCSELGAGEILLTAVHRDGARRGFDLELTRRVTEAVTVPVIASGGASTPFDFVEALDHGGADGALAAGIFHDRAVTIRAVKAALTAAGMAAAV